ncbi:unnamed protein product, partial [Lampetra planeri]
RGVLEAAAAPTPKRAPRHGLGSISGDVASEIPNELAHKTDEVPHATTPWGVVVVGGGRRPRSDESGSAAEFRVRGIQSAGSVPLAGKAAAQQRRRDTQQRRRDTQQRRRDTQQRRRDTQQRRRDTQQRRRDTQQRRVTEQRSGGGSCGFHDRLGRSGRSISAGSEDRRSRREGDVARGAQRFAAAAAAQGEGARRRRRCDRYRARPGTSGAPRARRQTGERAAPAPILSGRGTSSRRTSVRLAVI